MVSPSATTYEDAYAVTENIMQLNPNRNAIASFFKTSLLHYIMIIVSGICSANILFLDIRRFAVIMIYGKKLP